VRTSVKKVEIALAAGDKDAARKALEAAAPEIQGSVRKGVMHKNTAARKIGRLTQRLKGL
jgi:small subunit ribosomal protein S20